MQVINKSMISIAVAHVMRGVRNPLIHVLSNRNIDGLFNKKTKPNRIYRTGTSKYMPHQGKQECARRLKQAERIACK